MSPGKLRGGGGGDDSIFRDLVDVFFTLAIKKYLVSALDFLE
jgi:hypothetical protein